MEVSFLFHVFASSVSFLSPRCPPACSIPTFPSLLIHIYNLSLGRGQWNVDPNSVSVTGFSSGAYFAVQFQVAHSASIMGAAIFAGGPYYCTQFT